MIRNLLLGVIIVGFVADIALGQSNVGPSGVSQSYVDSSIANLQSAVPGLAPVQAVNTKTGQVTVPTLCRQQNITPTAIPQTNPGTITWAFPNTSCSFVAAPTCWAQIASSSTAYQFDFPMVSAISTSSVTMNFTAHAAGLTIASVLSLPLSLSVLVAVPAGATATITCTGAPA